MVARKQTTRLVLLVQLPIPPVGLARPRGNIPLAAGYLKAYAQRHCGGDVQIEILPQDIADRYGDAALVAEILDREPWLVGFCCYLWNIERTLWVAGQLKQHRAETLIVLGGPEITPDNTWVLQSGAADYAVVGEGEATFARLLHALGSRRVSPDAIPGAIPLGCRGAALSDFGLGQPNPIEPLDEVPSPYLSGVLAPDGEGTIYLETLRGCRFRCKYCYYPKSFRRLRMFSQARVLETLRWANTADVKEIVLLDPTLNGRRDFDALLDLLARGNSAKRFSYSAELRAELLEPGQAERLAAARVSEVEIGLQTVDPLAQQLASRRTDPEAFARGAKALADAGIRRRVDLIVGLPGDRADSVRRGIEFLARHKLYDEVQVFNLSVLPGTAFRRNARRLGLVYQDRPPYAVLRTPTLQLEQIAMLIEEAEAAFGTRFDPLPAAAELVRFADSGRCQSTAQSSASRAGLCGNLTSSSSLAEVVRVPLDRAGGNEPWALLPPPQRWANSLLLWMQAADFDAARHTAAAVLDYVLRQAPHTTLHAVIEPQGDYRQVSPRSLALLLETSYQTVSYLDRYYSVQPGRLRGAKRLVVVAPEPARKDRHWRQAASQYAELVFRSTRPGGSLDASRGVKSYVSAPRTLHRCPRAL